VPPATATGMPSIWLPMRCMCSRGGGSPRDDVLAGVAGADVWSSFAIENPAVLALSDDSAAVVYRAHAQRQDQPPYEAAITSVYRRRDGTWELVVHQQTPLPGD
jgi:hypothetical protein